MQPVMSELGIYVANHEARARREAARKDRLVREAVALGNGRGMIARFAHAVRQFVDPRGYAMAEMQPHVAATLPVEAPPVTVNAPVTLLESVECAREMRDPLKAA